jgi:hydroxyacylglutathione hydrolase
MSAEPPPVPVLSGVPVDPWDLRHLLLSLDDRPRNPRDTADLDAVVARAVAALTSVPPRPPMEVPASLTAPLLVEGIPIWLFEANAWLVAPEGPGGDCIVVDVPPSPGALVDRIEALDLRPVAIVLTHGHLDHACGVGALLQALLHRVPAYLHPADRLVLRREAKGVLARSSAATCHPASGVLLPLDEAALLDVGPVKVRPIHTPGHTPGSTCFLVEGGAHPLLFTGDVLFAGGTGRCDLAAGSRPTAEASLRSLLARLPDETIVLPGHGPITTVGAERADHLPVRPLAEGA